MFGFALLLPVIFNPVSIQLKEGNTLTFCRCLQENLTSFHEQHIGETNHICNFDTFQFFM